MEADVTCPVLKTVDMTADEFFALPEYSCSIPTGAVVGKRWRRCETFGRKASAVEVHNDRDVEDPDMWLMGEYADDPDAKVGRDGRPETVRILWYRIRITSRWKDKFVESVMES